MILVARTYWGGMPFWFRRPPDGARRGVARAAHRRHAADPGALLDAGVRAGAARGRRRHPPPRRFHAPLHGAAPRRRGVGVLAANSRYVGNDTGLRARGARARRGGVREVAAQEGRGRRAWCCWATAAAARSRPTTRRRQAPARSSASSARRADADALRHGGDDAGRRRRDRGGPPRAGARHAPIDRRRRRRRGGSLRQRAGGSTCTIRGTASASLRPRRRYAPDFVYACAPPRSSACGASTTRARDALADHAAAVEETRGAGLRRAALRGAPGGPAPSSLRAGDGRPPHDGQPRLRRSRARRRSRRGDARLRLAAQRPPGSR